MEGMPEARGRLGKGDVHPAEDIDEVRDMSEIDPCVVVDLHLPLFARTLLSAVSGRRYWIQSFFAYSYAFLPVQDAFTARVPDALPTLQQPLSRHRY